MTPHVRVIVGSQTLGDVRFRAIFAGISKSTSCGQRERDQNRVPDKMRQIETYSQRNIKPDQLIHKLSPRVDIPLKMEHTVVFSPLQVDLGRKAINLRITDIRSIKSD